MQLTRTPGEHLMEGSSEGVIAPVVPEGDDERPSDPAKGGLAAIFPPERPLWLSASQPRSTAQAFASAHALPTAALSLGNPHAPSWPGQCCRQHSRPGMAGWDVTAGHPMLHMQSA